MVRAICPAALCAALFAAPAATAASATHEPLRAKADGFLTRPSDERPVTVALDYVRAHARTFELDSNDIAGLRLTRAYRSGGGAVHLQWEQIYRRIPVFGPGLRANVAADGELINVGEAALPDPGVSSTEPRLAALDAVLAAARAAKATVAPGKPSAPKGSERATTFTSGDRASLTLFAGNRLAWRVLLHADPTHVYDAVVDATSGETLYRVNMVKEAADDALVFENYPGAGAGGVQATRSLTPWLSETPRTRLYGANAWVYADQDDLIDGEGSDPAPGPTTEIPPGDPPAGHPTPVGAGEWTYHQITQDASAPGQDCPMVGCSWNNFTDPPTFSWRVNRNQAGTQLFYYVNRFHDHLRDAGGIGFGPSSGNFELGDAVRAQVANGAATDGGEFPSCGPPVTLDIYTNNAFVIPVRDGTPLLMEFFLWSSLCTGGSEFDVNPVDDALIVYHEYTHGMTNRLVTDAAGNPALNGPQPGAVDEGTADWYALDFLVAQGLEPDGPTPGQLTAGRYENDEIRSQPFDCPVPASSPVCPGAGAAGSGGYTYGDFAKIAGDPEVHADGEIWVETLWDLRTRMIAAHGAAVGVPRMRALVTDGLRLAPANPTFLQMRNAILQADTSRGFGDRALIWSVFAVRGMGYRATTTGSNDVHPVQDFSLPPSGGPSTNPPPRTDRTRPTLAKASMARKSFKVGARSAFKFTLSEVATVEIAIARAETGRKLKGRCRRATRRLRKRPRCTRYVAAGSLVRINMSAGAHSVGFAGKLRGHALKAGAYKATIRATDPSGNRSRAATTSFRIVRR